MTSGAEEAGASPVGVALLAAFLLMVGGFSCQDLRFLGLLRCGGMADELINLLEKVAMSFRVQRAERINRTIVVQGPGGFTDVAHGLEPGPNDLLGRAAVAIRSEHLAEGDGEPADLLAFFGGLIYFAFWCAKHFGLIG